MAEAEDAALFVIEGMCLDMGPMTVIKGSHFRLAGTQVPCILGRPGAKAAAAGESDPGKLGLVGANKHVSRKHVCVDWDSSTGLYRVNVLSKIDIVVDGKAVAPGNGKEGSGAPLHSGSAMRLGNVLCYFLLPQEHVAVFPQSLLPEELKQRRALLASAAIETREKETGAAGRGGAGAAASQTGEPHSAKASDAGTPVAASTGPGPKASHDRSDSSPAANPSGGGSPPAAASSSSSKAGAQDKPSASNTTGFGYRSLTLMAHASMPRGRWTGRDIADRLSALFPDPASLPAKSRLRVSVKPYLRALRRAEDGEVTEAELEAAVKRGHARPRLTTFHDADPEDTAAELDEGDREWLARRMREMALPLPRALGGDGAAVDPLFAAAGRDKAAGDAGGDAEAPAAKRGREEAETAEDVAGDSDGADERSSAAEAGEAGDVASSKTGANGASEPSAKKPKPAAPRVDDDGEGVEI